MSEKIVPSPSASSAPLWSWTVSPFFDGQRADRSLREAFEAGEGVCEPEPSERAVSRAQIQKLMSEGSVLRNGRSLSASDRFRSGDLVELRFPPPPTHENLRPIDLKLKIHFEDEHLAVVDKPAGISTHPAPTENSETLVHGLLFQFPHLAPAGGALRPGIVHRLDKYTSGLLIVAKTDAAYFGLIKAFQERRVRKFYQALVYGAPATGENGIRIDTPFGRHPADRKRMAVLDRSPRRAVSIVHRETVFGQGSSTRVRVEILTGRTHQIRVHLAHLGFSVMGDQIYGTPKKTDTKWTRLPEKARAILSQAPGQYLHACSLELVHPVLGHPLLATSPVPEIFVELEAALG